ncbi:MAG: AMP-dependent synthetase/ligase [Solirubrobacteraceae bacterium]
MTDTTSVLDQNRLASRAPVTLGEMLLRSAARHGGTALEEHRGGRLVRTSYPELATRARQVAAGLIALGVAPGDRVAIFATTCAQWTVIDYGILCAGAVVVPVYHTSSAEECAYVLSHSGATVVFCGDGEQTARVARARTDCPDLRHVVLFEGEAEGTVAFDDLIARGAATPSRVVDERIAGDRDALATIVYTSGTTGPPKGCMLTHANLLETARMYVDELGIGEPDVLYQFLPLAHVLARVAQAVVLRGGATITFWSGDASRIVDELGERAPTHFPAVPRVYEKIHGTIMGRVQDGPWTRRKLFDWAIAQGRRERQGDGGRPSLRYRVADRLVLSRIRTLFGNRLQLALVGAAAVAPELLEFFDACGVLILEGYGLTESCSVATLNTPDRRRFGSVGHALAGTEVAIADDGEILIRGPQVFGGYYRDAAATHAALTPDGWLQTGDLGSLSPDGFLSITGRKKDLIITSSGKNITPVNIESQLRETRYIREAVVFGDNRPYLVALLSIDPDETAKLAARLGITGGARAAVSHPAVRAEIQREVDAVNARLARIEQIKRFAILERDLTQADGELTPTLKVKRSAVYEKYADVFAGLYEGTGT